MKANIALLAILAIPAFSQRDVTFEAEVRGSGSSGKCTIEVNVDGVADITIRGNQGRMRTQEGQPARWVRFQCNAPFPHNMREFRFRGIDGRGRQVLLQDPRNSNGSAVVRIEDPKGGSEGYTFDIEWRDGFSGSGGGFPGGRRGDSSAHDAIRNCQDSVRDRAGRDFNVRDLNFTSTNIDNNSGRRDYITGSFQGRRDGGRSERFDFSCQVNLGNGSIRSVDIRPLGR